MAKKGITGAKKITVNDALKLYDSTAMIGNVHERFDILTSHPDHLRQDLDWRSFYDGWIEGRFGMYGELYTMVYPTTKPSRWNDFKDIVKTSGGCIKDGIARGWRVHQASIRDEVVMFWKVEAVLILVFVAFVLGAFVMATFGIQGKCYFP